MVGIIGITSSPIATNLVSNSKPQEEIKSVEAIPNSGFVSSRIRVDNILDIAILEIRNSDNGELVQQFPNERQINAFAKAEELQQEQAQQRKQEFKEVALDITNAQDSGLNISSNNSSSSLSSLSIPDLNITTVQNAVPVQEPTESLNIQQKVNIPSE